jgi:hypothetical protein
MNCTAALEAMLDAEPQALSGHGSTVLAVHIASCRKCGSVAERLVADTRLLANAIARSQIRSHSRRPRWVQRALVPAGLVAAALLVFVVQFTPNAPAGTAGPVAVLKTTDPVAPGVGVATIATPRNVSERTRAFPSPVAVQPVRIVAQAPAAVTPSRTPTTVTVDPPAGTRVAVMRTDNPKFTVVWLY